MARRTASISIKNTGNVRVWIDVGFGLASATFDPNQGFPSDKYLGDIAKFSGSPPDVRDIWLEPNQTTNITVTFYDDGLISTYGGKTIYFLIVVWKSEASGWDGKTIYAYKFIPFTVSLPNILGSFDASPSKSTASTGETIYITYKVNLNRNADIYLVFQSNKELWQNQSAGYHEYNKYFTLPSSPGTYTYTVGVEIPATGEKSYKNISITVVNPIEIRYFWYGVTRAYNVDISFTAYNNTNSTINLEVSLTNRTTNQTYYDTISVGANSSRDYYKNFGPFNQVYGCSYTCVVKRKDNGQVVFSRDFSL